MLYTAGYTLKVLWFGIGLGLGMVWLYFEVLYNCRIALWFGIGLVLGFLVICGV
jgi:hypothetical protein